jgi:hypothetical protein
VIACEEEEEEEEDEERDLINDLKRYGRPASTVIACEANTGTLEWRDTNESPQVCARVA